MLKLFLAVGAMLSVFLLPTSSGADSPDLFSGKRITSSGDWRLEYRDAMVMADQSAVIIGDVCTLVTGSKDTWLSFGFVSGFVNVSIYASVWKNPRTSRTVLLRSNRAKIILADAVFDGAFIQTSLPPNEIPERSMRLLADSARNSPIELMRMPGEKLMVTFSGRGLAALLDRAIECSRKTRN